MSAGLTKGCVVWNKVTKKRVIVEYGDNELDLETYNHQDEDYSQLCNSPWCKCQQ